MCEHRAAQCVCVPRAGARSFSVGTADAEIMANLSVENAELSQVLSAWEPGTGYVSSPTASPNTSVSFNPAPQSRALRKRKKSQICIIRAVNQTFSRDMIPRQCQFCRGSV